MNYIMEMTLLYTNISIQKGNYNILLRKKTKTRTSYGLISYQSSDQVFTKYYC